jgi:hypothetical protein
MERPLIEIERKILEELHVDVARADKGHHGVFPVEVVINTLRVTMGAKREDIEKALQELSRLQLIEKGIHAGDTEVLSITDRGRHVLKAS